MVTEQTERYKRKERGGGEGRGKRTSMVCLGSRREGEGPPLPPLLTFACLLHTHLHFPDDEIAAKKGGGGKNPFFFSPFPLWGEMSQLPPLISSGEGKKITQQKSYLKSNVCETVENCFE